ncbi:hypothetical protein N7475_006958 [Penicillium sp. IBT 31633x]|nr:hypothetical protein N7475_006958 [Penicillium sp. IBT 31633x]
MIRPHAHHFCYDATEFEAMKDKLISLKSHGADGFVFGILNRVPKDRCDPTMSWIDVSRNKELVRLAEGRPCTFHRAFDLIPESHWKTALADIMDCGFASILTNGGPSGTKATECVDKLRALVHWRKAQLRDRNSSLGNQVPEIIVGGGVRASNVGCLLSEITDATAFHSAALRDSDELVCESEVLEMKHQTSGSLRTHKNGE